MDIRPPHYFTHISDGDLLSKPLDVVSNLIAESRGSQGKVIAVTQMSGASRVKLEHTQ